MGFFRKVRWAPVGLIVASLFAAVAASGAARVSEANIGSEAALAFVAAALIFPLFWLASLRNRSAESAVAHFAVLFAVALVSVVGSVSAEKDQIRQVSSNLSQTFNRMSDDNTTELGAGAQADPALGEAGELQRVMTDFMVRLKDQRTDYLREFKALAIGDMLTPEHLAATRDFGPDRRKLAEAHALIQTYRGRSLGQLDEMKTSVRSSSLSPANKEATLKGMSETEGDAVVKINRTFDLESRAVDDISAATLLLDRTRGRWSARSGKLLFQDQRDLDRYAALMADITQATAEEKALRDTSRTRSLETFSRMRELAK